MHQLRYQVCKIAGLVETILCSKRHKYMHTSCSGRFAIRFCSGFIQHFFGSQRYFHYMIIGIFSRLAARDNKKHYLDYLPRVWRHLERDLLHPSLAPLKQWVDRHVDARHRGVIAIRHNADDLALTA